MDILSNFKKAPEVRPMLNIGCLLDIPTGSYLKGKHGESILNGGLSYLTGIGGRGNTYKSTIGHFMVLRILDRYSKTQGLIYDTENSLTYQRIDHLASSYPTFKETNVTDSGRMGILDKDTIVGDQWFADWKDVISKRKKEKDDATTPFISRDGVNIKTKKPFICELDSFSQMDIQVVDEMLDRGNIGSSKLNTEALKTASAKSQMLVQLPGLTGITSGSYLIMTAHVGDEHQLDPYAPPAKKLAFLKGKVKFKRVPENFTFLTNNLWYSTQSNVMINQSTKAPEFPRNKKDDLKGDTDLMLVSLINVRAKSGPTGLPVEIIVSQSDGVHVGLTEFYYIKTHNRYGLGGNDRSYYLELVPDVNLQRTTIRGTIDNDIKIQRALEITSEMAQMQNMWHHLPEDFIVDPATLYEGLKSKGYDWDILLSQTRGYWVFEEEEKKNTKYFLSTMDLLNMYHGTYVPYWYKKATK